MRPGVGQHSQHSFPYPHSNVDSFIGRSHPLGGLARASDEVISTVSPLFVEFYLKTCTGAGILLQEQEDRLPVAAPALVAGRRQDAAANAGACTAQSGIRLRTRRTSYRQEA